MEIDDGGISLVINDQPQEESIIKVIGVGGGGSNAVNHGICCMQYRYTGFAPEPGEKPYPVGEGADRRAWSG